MNEVVNNEVFEKSNVLEDDGGNLEKKKNLSKRRKRNLNDSEPAPREIKARAKEELKRIRAVEILTAKDRQLLLTSIAMGITSDRFGPASMQDRIKALQALAQEEKQQKEMDKGVALEDEINSAFEIVTSVRRTNVQQEPSEVDEDGTEND